MLRLTNTFLGKEDTQLTEKLRGELPGILLWAIAGWQRLRERGHFVQPEAGRELAGEMKDLSSPVGVSCASVALWGRLTKPPLRMCTRRGAIGAKPTGGTIRGPRATFGRDLRAAVPDVKVGQPREDGARRARV